MRVLLTSPSGLGHIHPMVPLARALVARGRDVLWATPANGVGHVERIGISAVGTGPAGLPGPAEVRRQYPELDALPQLCMPQGADQFLIAAAVESAGSFRDAAKSVSVSIASMPSPNDVAAVLETLP